MKRLLSLLLVGAMLLGLTACGKEQSLVEDDLVTDEGGVSLNDQEDYAPSITLNDVQKKEEEEYQKDLAANAVGTADPEVIEKREEAPVEELSETDRLRPDTNYGACSALKGKVGVILFFLNDKDSKWTDDEAKAFTKNELQPALDFIENEAKERKIDLELSIKKTYTDLRFSGGDVITSVEQTGKASVGIMKQLARDMKYSSDAAMYQDFKNKYKCDEVLMLAIFNKPGSSYAVMNRRERKTEYEEYAVLFPKELSSGKVPKAGLLAAPLAYELLRLYGAQVLFTPIPRNTLAKLHFNGDIMLSTHVNVITNVITDATAFYIGWLDTPPETLKNPDWSAE